MCCSLGCFMPLATGCHGHLVRLLLWRLGLAALFCHAVVAHRRVQLQRLCLLIVVPSLIGGHSWQLDPLCVCMQYMTLHRRSIWLA
jgi:hypothetical protein